MERVKKVWGLTMVALFTCYITGAQENGEISGEPLTITATYDGFTSDSYSFTFINDEGDEESIFFDYATDEVLEEFDLNSEEWEGQKFEVIYQETTETEEEEGEELEYTKTAIISLKPVE